MPVSGLRPALSYRPGEAGRGMKPHMWAVQPRFIAPEWRWAWNGLKAPWLFWEGAGSTIRAVRPRIKGLSLAMDPDDGWEQERFGLAVNYPSTTDGSRTSGVPVFTGSENRTVVVFLRWSGVASASGMGIFSLDEGVAGNAGERWTFKIDDAGSGLRIEIQGSGFTTGLVVPANEWVVAACRLDGTTLGDHTLFLGHDSEQATGAATVNSLSTNDTVVGYHATLAGDRALRGDVALVLAYDRALRDTEIHRLVDDPFGPFRMWHPVWANLEIPVDNVRLARMGYAWGLPWMGGP